MGRTVGAAFREEIREAVACDPEVKLCLALVAKTVRGAELYASYLALVEERYPKYLAELKGLRTATGVPLKSLLCSCLRQVNSAHNSTKRTKV